MVVVVCSIATNAINLSFRWEPYGRAGWTRQCRFTMWTSHYFRRIFVVPNLLQNLQYSTVCPRCTGMSLAITALLPFIEPAIQTSYFSDTPVDSDWIQSVTFSRLTFTFNCLLFWRSIRWVYNFANSLAIYFYLPPKTLATVKQPPLSAWSPLASELMASLVEALRDGQLQYDIVRPQR